MRYSGSMKTILSRLHVLLLAALVMSGAAVESFALPMAGPAAPQSAVMTVSDDCNAVGQRYAAQVGGQFNRAWPETRNGQTVCVVVVLMPASDGQRPRREQVELPAG